MKTQGKAVWTFMLAVFLFAAAPAMSSEMMMKHGDGGKHEMGQDHMKMMGEMMSDMRGMMERMKGMAHDDAMKAELNEMIKKMDKMMEMHNSMMGKHKEHKM